MIKISRSEFRYNKKRKHYAYLYGDKSVFRKNILLSTKDSVDIKSGDRIRRKRNIKLNKAPDGSTKTVFVINKAFLDHRDSFDDKVYDWKFDISDKRKIKKIKKKYRFHKK